MDPKPSVSLSFRILLWILQFVVLVLLIVNAWTFIRNVADQKGSVPTTIDMDALAMKYVDPDDENITELIRTKVRCFNRAAERRTYQKGNFWVVENFIKATHGDLDCLETITYTTNGEYPYLDNLWAIVQKWKAPISLALYCGGEDFKNCMDSLAYIRNCAVDQNLSWLMKIFLSVHLFFEDTQIPPTVWRPFDDSNVDCTDNPMLRPTHRSTSGRHFYINIARNIARDAATTHFILASDIELYPSDDLIPQFLRMIAKSGGVNLKKNTVYVLPPFEVTIDSQPPRTKGELQGLLKDRNAVRFHQGMCDKCHRIPDPEMWEINSPDRDFGIFTSVTREGPHDFWEPFYIGTNKDPYFDERVPYEGGYNKMVQAFSMCLNHYIYSVLNNAFLIHRPGIRSYRKPSPQRNSTLLMLQRIWQEYGKLYGQNPECSIFYSIKYQKMFA